MVSADSAAGNGASEIEEIRTKVFNRILWKVSSKIPKFGDSIEMLNQ